MAVKRTTKSPLANKLKATFDKRKGETHELETSGGNFPGGIESGVAQIKSITIGTYKNGKSKGKEYFMIRGVALLPKKMPDGVPVEGCQDNLCMIPLCKVPDSKKYTSEEVGVDEMLAIIQDLGIDTADLDYDSLVDGSLFEELIEGGLYCRFRTWVGKATAQYPNPRVNVVYIGACEFDGESVEEDDELVDNTDDEEVEDEEVADEEESEEEEAEEEEGEEEEEDLVALGKAADKDDDDAQARLDELATEYGIDASKIKTWALTAKAIAKAKEEAEGEEEEEEEEEEEPAEPEKGDVFKYKPPRAKKHLEVEVTQVIKSKQTCNVKDLTTDEIIKGVPWSKLE